MVMMRFKNGQDESGGEKREKGIEGGVILNSFSQRHSKCVLNELKRQKVCSHCFFTPLSQDDVTTLIKKQLLKSESSELHAPCWVSDW
jgi:hypothetical protein